MQGKGEAEKFFMKKREIRIRVEGINLSLYIYMSPIHHILCLPRDLCWDDLMRDLPLGESPYDQL